MLHSMGLQKVGHEGAIEQYVLCQARPLISSNSCKSHRKLGFEKEINLNLVAG